MGKYERLLCAKSCHSNSNRRILLDFGLATSFTFLHLQKITSFVNTKYTIGKVATLSDVTTDTLRFYEKKGLITPKLRTAAGYRLYNEDAVNQVRFIKLAQSYGLTLSDVSKLLTQINEGKCYCSDVYKLATERKLQVSNKLAELETTSRALDDLIMNCDDGGSIAINSCPILGNLAIN